MLQTEKRLKYAKEKVLLDKKSDRLHEYEDKGLTDTGHDVTYTTDDRDILRKVIADSKMHSSEDKQVMLNLLDKLDEINK